MMWGAQSMKYLAFAANEIAAAYCPGELSTGTAR